MLPLLRVSYLAFCIDSTDGATKPTHAVCLSHSWSITVSYWNAICTVQYSHVRCALSLRIAELLVRLFPFSPIILHCIDVEVWCTLTPLRLRYNTSYTYKIEKKEFCRTMIISTFYVLVFSFWAFAPDCCRGPPGPRLRTARPSNRRFASPLLDFCRFHWLSYNVAIYSFDWLSKV